MRATGRTGEVTTVPVADEDVSLVLLVGVGEQSVTDFRRAGAALARATKDRASVVTSLAAIAPDGGLAGVVVGAMLGSFAFHWRSTGPQESPVARIVLAGVSDEGADDELALALAHGGAGWRSRTLATVPANLKTPAWLADQAVEIGGASGVEVTVWDEKKLAEEGFGGLLAVGGGSAHPPRLIRIDYTPRGRHASYAHGRAGRQGHHLRHRRPRHQAEREHAHHEARHERRRRGDRRHGRPAPTSAAPCAWSASSRPPRTPSAAPPCAPVTSSATTAGAPPRSTTPTPRAAWCWPTRWRTPSPSCRPTVLVDVATLTGAMKVALGQWTGGYFANHDGVAAQLDAAGATSGEKLWRMPLTADYEEKVCSKIADGDNAAGGAGAITAALFLQHFAGDVPWAPHRLRLRRRGADRPPRVDRRPQRLRAAPAADVAGCRGPARGHRPMKGLTVRWSLADAPDGVEDALASYVAETSHARFTGMAGLRFKTWRQVPW